ncbi:amino acid permease [Amycolatopsis sp. FU40]|uniref:amino acid permease n=1 Tax=Amycolatopsis sp. FU40 TaxID=2914159 RepID=UPI001F39663F|nr:amino acid permease [Amycolatopsis sp. FU40]UKD58920.1 amino acid permease [Amycolatopsis sp. FU40]
MTSEAAAEPAAEGLAAGLRQRHLAMLAMGGVIGSGLFVSSGVGIKLAGPGIVLSFVLAGTLAMLVMRMMAEMAAAIPSSGSFSVHAERAFGPWAGFAIGWLYWAALVVVLAVEATAAAIIVNGWLPGIPQWALVLIFMAVLTAVNFTAVSRFGELEFWLALIKVVAVVAFLVLGVLAFLGVLPGTSFVGTANLLGHGGLLPHGWQGVGTGLLAVVFTFGGLEVVTIAAAESDDPAHAVGKAVRNAVVRISVFYIGSMLVIVSLLPWPSVQTGQSPFAAVLERIGIPATGQVMNVVVLFALLSTLNTNMYGAARMVYSLARRGHAPRALTRVDRNGVPVFAVAASVLFGFVAVALNALWPDTVFQYLLNAVGSVLLIVWILVACTQLRVRKQLERTAPESLTVRMWGFPYLTWATLAAMVAILVVMAGDAGARIQLISSDVLVAVLVVAGICWQRARREAEQTV